MLLSRIIEHYEAAVDAYFVPMSDVLGQLQCQFGGHVTGKEASALIHSSFPTALESI